MMIFLRLAGVALLAIGFLGILVSSSVPFMTSGSPTIFRAALIGLALGWILLTLHAVLFAVKYGWAASGITGPGMLVFGLGLGAACWLLFGPNANAYPKWYGIGALVLTLVVASKILPRTVFPKTPKE